MTQDLWTLVEHQGYRLLPPAHRGSPGAGGLVVALRPVPSGKHYQPEALSVRLADETGAAGQRLLTPATPPLAAGRMCPGPLVMSDWRDKRLRFFTFGGQLRVAVRPDATLCAITSPAPILEVAQGQGSVAEDMASEVECRLAQAAAGWRGDEEGFARRLAAVEPLAVYVAAVHSLLKEHLGHESLGALYEDLDRVLAGEKEWLAEQGLWPADPPDLHALLGPEQIRDGR